MTCTCADSLSLSGARIRKSSQSIISTSLRRASCRAWARCRSRSSGRHGLSRICHPATAVPSSAAAYPPSRSAPIPHYGRGRPSVRVRYTESPRGSRKAVDYRQPRQTAHRSHALSLFLVAYTRSLAHPLLPPSLSLIRPSSRLLSFPLRLSPTLTPRLFAPLHKLCLAARLRSQIHELASYATITTP